MGKHLISDKSHGNDVCHSKLQGCPNIGEQSNIKCINKQVKQFSTG